MLVDSHCHLDKLDLTQYNGSLANAIADAHANNVTNILCVCIDLEHFPAVLAIAEAYQNVYASVGIHPTEIIPREPTVDALIQLGSHSKVVAFGETGLDYYRDDSNKLVQQERLRKHIQAAKALNKPVIIHTRQAQDDTINILKSEGADQVGGVMHCFTETWAMAQKAIDLNFYISFSGIVTFQNAKELKEVAKLVPLDRMLIETDAPYLAPVPYRGKPNQPAYVKHVAEYIAQLRGIRFEQLAEQTTENFFNLFKQARAQ
jgi:TatD DNase family protein